ncbi:J domain-containing protein [Salinigranum halophilum]|uniref:J domain-containing protein n=1 Tax=Salinigranum halophilum TaxID=2565931 RepID=UPI00115CA32E|nr:J domain-containing protein [Salinigranum halophilum]
MDRDRLVLGLAAVFAGLTVLLVVLSFTQQLFLLVLAVPFAATTYFMWYQASGRLQERTRTRRVRAGSRFRGPQGGQAGPTGPGGFGAGAQRQGQSQSRFGGQQASSGPSQREAYRTLGLDPGADEAAVRSAYRERVKEVHPDRPSGDEDEFKRVNRAYERLTEEPT